MSGGIRLTLELGQDRWKILYMLGAIAALLAVFVFRRNMGAELTAFRGFGVFTVPETVPVRAVDWFELLQADLFVGLTLLEIFDLVEYVLVGLIFLAVYMTLRQTDRGIVLLATIFAWVGIAVYFASNQAFAMLSLSNQYAVVSTEAQRALLLAAGEALLAVNNPGVLQQGTGIYLSLFLVLLAGLMLSVTMLKSGIFNKTTAVAGILANGCGLAYFPMLVIAPGLVALPFVISAPFRLIWYFLIALKLLKLAKN